MYSDRDILKAMEDERIIIEPFDLSQLGPNSYDVRLGDTLLVYKEVLLDVKEPNRIEKITIPEEGLILYPGELYLGHTVEYTECDNGIVPMYEGRSSMARLGIQSHISAGFGDAGYKGNWTLEINVMMPVKVYKGMRIGQVYFHQLNTPAKNPYFGKYFNAYKVMSSKSWEDREWSKD